MTLRVFQVVNTIRLLPKMSALSGRRQYPTPMYMCLIMKTLQRCNSDRHMLQESSRNVSLRMFHLVDTTRALPETPAPSNRRQHLIPMRMCPNTTRSQRCNLNRLMFLEISRNVRAQNPADEGRPILIPIPRASNRRRRPLRWRSRYSLHGRNSHQRHLKAPSLQSLKQIRHQLTIRSASLLREVSHRFTFDDQPLNCSIPSSLAG